VANYEIQISLIGHMEFHAKSQRIAMAQCEPGVIA